MRKRKGKSNRQGCPVFIVGGVDGAEITRGVYAKQKATFKKS
jgi:hypothetical protein